MEYALLIYHDEPAWAALSDEEREEVYAGFVALRRELQARGAWRGGGRLHPSDTATSVRVRDGAALVTDGPFAETKEQLGGYLVVEAETVDEALEWAARVPTARWGTVEVRPLATTEVRT